MDKLKDFINGDTTTLIFYFGSNCYIIIQKDKPITVSTNVNTILYNKIKNTKFEDIETDFENRILGCKEWIMAFNSMVGF